MLTRLCLHPLLCYIGRVVVEISLQISVICLASFMGSFVLLMSVHLHMQILSAKVSKTYPGQLHQVPYEIIDRIVQTVLEDPLPTYTVYLLNLKPQTHGKYAYIYSESAKAAYLTKCLGSLWTGKERYMWIDLAAGPVEYGPATSGEGYVKGEMLPIASTYSSSQQTTLAADLASLVWSAARMLFVPAVRIPVSFWTDLEVNSLYFYACFQALVVGSSLESQWIIVE